MEQVIYQVAIALIAIFSALVTSVLIPYIKKKTTAADYDRISNWVTIAVAAAQQIYKASGSGVLRKEYVIAFLKQQGVTLTEAQLDALIEAAVFELNQILLEVQDDNPETPTA